MLKGWLWILINNEMAPTQFLEVWVVFASKFSSVGRKIVAEAVGSKPFSPADHYQHAGLLQGTDVLTWRHCGFISWNQNQLMVVHYGLGIVAWRVVAQRGAEYIYVYIYTHTHTYIYMYFSALSVNFQPLYFNTWLNALPKASLISVSGFSGNISIFMQDSQGFYLKYS